MNIKSLKLRHLSAFVETVRAGSLKAGAERVNITQSAISKAIADLEKLVDVRLMDRDRSGIELTPAGVAFLPFAEQGLAALSFGMASVEALASGRKTPLRIGALPSVAADFLPNAIQHFSQTSPNTPILVEDGRIGDLIGRLRAGALDLVIGRLGSDDIMHGVSFTQLYSEKVIFAAAAGHDLAQARDLADLKSALVLFPPNGAAIFPIVKRFLMSQGISEFPKILETVSGPFGRAMTLGPAQAIWIISQGVVARDIAAGRITALPINTDAMSGAVGVMARSEEQSPPALQVFRQVLLDAGKDHDGNQP